ncbi:trefoil factor 3-like [Dendropsophus ebraccatus]|uniref:trefoil factor 3-like n=1 Tax=Dendropsophus ebraccatus TaxID=150705 RepID=UPI0038321C1D
MSLCSFLVLTLTIISVQLLQTKAGPALTEAQCTLPPRERTDCGFGGIGEQECIRKGCCFDSRIPGVIWCYKVPEPVVPDIEPEPQVPEIDPVPQIPDREPEPQIQIQEPKPVDDQEVCID